MNTKLIKKYTSYSTKDLQKMVVKQTGEDFEAIVAVLERRGQLIGHPDPKGAVINPTETPQYEEENGITEEDKKAWAEAEKKEEKDRAGKRLTKKEVEQLFQPVPPLKGSPVAEKAEKEEKPLKKARTTEEAEQLYRDALRLKGFPVAVKTFRGHREVTGTVIGVRLDRRSNFVQYRIKLLDGTIIGKGVDNPDIIITGRKIEKSVAEAPASNED